MLVYHISGIFRGNLVNYTDCTCICVHNCTSFLTIILEKMLFSGDVISNSEAGCYLLMTVSAHE